MQELRDLMRHKRLGVWGDSHGRNLYTQFIRMLTGTFDDKVDELAKHYQDGFWHGISATGETAANYLMGDLHLSLRWHTTIPRMAHEIYQLQQTSLGLPDVVIISTSSWYYRHKLPVYQLEHDLQELRVAVEAADAAARKAGRHLLWLLLTVPSRVRGRNRSSTWSAPLQAISVYNKALQASGLLHPQGPMLLLDLHALSEGCLAWCSYDGIHANAAVYALVNQMIANLLKLPPDVDRFDDHSAPGSAVAVGSAKPVGTAAKTTAPGPSRPLKKSQAVAVNLQQIAAKRAMSKQGLQAGAKQPR
ncbi:hypothetical protein CHLNCDRAFT_144254 [Chlorella variabilis]|uniref:SGNH hydrolase-type esterase domain-containing protein n=1 Tax=Chlorella variabilis TaxID=554065 RepID=E1ZC99_CHLVA|nr:hypothetical protein CHLNCDRAFT_144254 [Chlorella variabilis]EFN56772.1 hypothetical protein CHLNCDRAFT_144254 [Chlorella variabilis]|eukprot:XP_005848874.1 hypothetical protein CHLNCDRAFT_144254 [Chlorella variabilis]